MASMSTLSLLGRLPLRSHSNIFNNSTSSLTSSSSSFVYTNSSTRPLCLSLGHEAEKDVDNNSDNNIISYAHDFQQVLRSVSLPLTAATLPSLLDAKDALAVGGEFGILEGRTFALIHPVLMGGLFFYTLWAGYLGWQWRRVRTIQDEINQLKAQVKPKPKPVSVTPDGSPSHEQEQQQPPSPVELKIQQLTEERKELIKGSFRDRHFNAGSILLGFGVLESVGGGLNTWFRTGKLFPGPHLFAGAGTDTSCLTRYGYWQFPTQHMVT